jgi:nucleoside-diphosphate-sugar epimerase
MRTLLIAGFGDVARRAIPLLSGHWRILALVHDTQQQQLARELHVEPILANLDHRPSLARLAGLADAVLYTAPPPKSGRNDPRLANLLSALAKANSIPQQLVYISTPGIYGNCNGAWLTECAKPAPQTPRAHRRLAAESLLRRLAHRWPISITVLRAPGIYAAGRLPLERIEAGYPVPLRDEDSYVNHIHADDLAAMCVKALQRRGGIRFYHACDDLPLLSGDWFELLADAFALPRPPRMARQQLFEALPAQRASFLAESRRLYNDRIKRELQIRLRYPDVHEFLHETGQALALQAKIR